MMDNSEVAANAGKEFAPQQPEFNVGLTLREARELLGISVHEVADRIKFAPKQVEALEANDFTHLPQATFLRGFVRSYARMLQLDEAPLIAALPGGPATSSAAKQQTRDTALPAMLSSRRVNVLWLAGTVGVALVLALFVLLRDGEPTAEPAKAVVESLPLPGSDAAVSAVAETAAPAQALEPAPEPAPIAEPEKAPEPVKISQPEVKPVPKIAAAPAPADAPKSAVPLEQLKRRPMHFVFDETTWVEVVDANGAVLLSKTNPRGSEQWIGGPRRAPYEVTIAHPGHVKLYYKGKEIDLSPYAGMETARLKVE